MFQQPQRSLPNSRIHVPSLPSHRPGATLQPTVVSSETPSARPGTSSMEPEDAYDARGRARPIYGSRSPRPPEVWHPGPWAQLIMGLVPGVRSLASGHIRRGAPYTVLGLCTVIGALLLLASYSTSIETLHNLRIQPRFILVHAASIWLLVAAYEFLRLGAALEEHSNYVSRAPRLLAAMWLPAFLLTTVGPSFVTYAPHLLESVWFASIVVLAGATPAVLWCTLDDFLNDANWHPAFRLGITLWCVGLLFAAIGFVAGLGHAWAPSALEAGFQVLPRLLE